MRPTHPSSGRSDLFPDRPDAMINPKHPLVTLSRVMDWARFDETFGGFLSTGGQAREAHAAVGHQLPKSRRRPTSGLISRSISELGSIARRSGTVASLSMAVTQLMSSAISMPTPMRILPSER